MIFAPAAASTGAMSRLAIALPLARRQACLRYRTAFSVLLNPSCYFSMQRTANFSLACRHSPSPYAWIAVIVSVIVFARLLSPACDRSLMRQKNFIRKFINQCVRNALQPVL
jgi:hypothetical protein